MFGFEVTCKVQVANDDEFDIFIDELIEAVESRNLIAGGGGTLNDYSLFLYGSERYSSASESDRAYMKDWLKKNACANSIVIGDLIDVHYGVF